MHILGATLCELRRRTPRVAAFAAVVIASSTLSIVLTIGASRVTAQMSSTRHVYVTVTNSQGRLVTGLHPQNFEVFENGVCRAITDLSAIGSLISLAIVGEQPLLSVGPLGPRDEVIQTPSLSNAVRQLAASKNPRKVLLTTANTDLQPIPSGIQRLQIDPANLPEALIELRRQYKVGFESATPSASVEVVLRQPVGIHDFKLDWM